MASYPDYGKAPETYLLAVTELLAGFSDDVLAAVMDLRSGVRARCTFLPTVADIVKCADDYIKRRDQFKPLPRYGIYQLLTGPAEREPTEEERQRAREHWSEVRNEIKPAADRLCLPPDIRDEQIPEWLDKHLKTPPAPPSAELIELVRQQRERDPEAERWV